MKRTGFGKEVLAVVILAISIIFTGGPPAIAEEVPTKFNYQAYLTDSGGTAINDSVHDFEFTVMDAATAGNAVGPTVTYLDQTVTSGRVNIQVALPPASFAGSAARYLKMRICTNGVSWEELTPRQQIVSVPYAYKALDENLSYRSCLRYVSATQVKVLAGTIIDIAGARFEVAADTTLAWADLDTGAEEGGKDYHIFALNNAGTLVFKIHKTTAYNDYIDINGEDAGGLTYPTGYTSATAKVIGGFHNNATNVSAGAGDILQYSVWNRKNRPACPDPRGMVKSKYRNVWYDIYLASAWDAATQVTTMPGSDPYNQPTYKVRSVYQGTIWDTMTWYFAQQRGHNSGKRLLSYDEFMDMATGTPEGVNITGSADPVTTGGHISTGSVRMVSAIGAEDAAGVLWQWGNGLYYRADGTLGWGWVGNTGGYGSIYHYAQYDPIAPGFGGYWVYAADAGSRSLILSAYVWYTDTILGGRFACDSL